VVYFHGGGWRNGSKEDLKHKLCGIVMESGSAFAAANYRLTYHAPHPAQLHDAARAIQFLRSKAAEWNIDPTRIAAYGGSAGGSISLWLALHNDMADPASDDPIARQSTRLSCAISINGQSTNDPRVIRKIIPRKAYDQSALKPLFGLPADWDWDTAEVSEELSARLIDGSPISHLTEDDPPVFVYHTKSAEVPGNIHHPNFGRYLKKNMNAMNIECIFRMDSAFDALDVASYFTNSSFGISPDISQVPPSIFPTTSLAFVVSLLSDDGGYLYLGAYDRVPGDPGDEKGTQITLDSEDGVFCALEAGIQDEETGTKLAGGGWYRMTDFEAEFSGRSYSHNSGVYIIGETNLTDHWAGFFQLGNADKDRNQVGFYASVGLVYSSLLMEDDIFGVGLARAENSGKYRDLNPGADDHEMALECTYVFNPKDWLILQPGVQFIKNPGMDPDLDDAVAFSLRAYMSF